MKDLRHARWAASLIAAISGTAIGQQDEARWIGALGNWADASNWSTDPFAPQNGIPLGRTYRVVLEDTGDFYQITLDDDRTIDEMVIDSPDAFVFQEDGTLRVLGDITVLAGSMTCQGDRLRSAHVTVTGGAFGFGSSTPFVLEDVTLTGDFTLAGTTFIEGGFDLQGTLTFGASNLLLTDSRSFNNCTFALGQGIISTTGDAPDPLEVVFGESCVVTAGPTSQLSARYNDSWVNHGTITQSGVSNGDGLRLFGSHFSNRVTGNIVVTGDPSKVEFQTQTWENEGSMSVLDGGSLCLLSEDGGINRGTIDVTDGELAMLAQWTNEGTIQGTRATILFGAQPGSGDPAERWRNSGQLLGDDTMFRLGGIFTPADLGDLALSGDSTLSITGFLDNTNAVFIVDASGPRWTIDEGLISGGRIETRDDRRLEIFAAGRIEDATVEGDLGFFASNRPFFVRDGLQLDAGSFLLSGSQARLVFDAPITLDDYELRVETNSQFGNRQCEIEIGPNAHLTIGVNSILHGHVSIRRDGGNTGQTVHNLGTISADVPGGYMSMNPSVFTNDGLCEVVNGSLLQIAPTDSWSNNGTIRVVQSIAELGSSAPWTNSGTIEGIEAEIGLGGTLRTSDFGSVVLDDSSFVLLQARIELEGGTFELTPAFGDWRSSTARFVDGTFSTVDTALRVTNRVEFENVTVDAEFEFDPNTSVIIHGTAEFDRPLNMRSSDSNRLELRGPTTIPRGIIDVPAMCWSVTTLR